MNNYFYLDQADKQQGPISPDKFAKCGVKRSTMVWCSGMAEWQRAEDVPELRNFFDGQQGQDTPPEPPHSTSYERTYNNDNYSYSNRDDNRQTGFTQCPETHMVGAVIATAVSFVFGFSILGILAGLVAIYNADSVSTNYRRGYLDEAEYASRKAKKWMKISLILWAITRLIIIPFYVLFVALFAFNPMYYW